MRSIRTSLTGGITLVRGEGSECLHLSMGVGVDENIITQLEGWSYHLRVTSLLITMSGTSVDQINHLYRLSSMLNKEDFQFRLALVVKDPARAPGLEHFLRDYSSLLSTQTFADEVAALRWLTGRRQA